VEGLAFSCTLLIYFYCQLAVMWSYAEGMNTEVGN